MTERRFMLFGAVIALASQTSVLAQNPKSLYLTTGQQLLKYCSVEEKTYWRGHCFGYISGISDLSPDLLIVNGTRLPASGESETIARCSPQVAS
jgi:hypothetical protein